MTLLVAMPFVTNSVLARSDALAPSSVLARSDALCY